MNRFSHLRSPVTRAGTLGRPGARLQLAGAFLLVALAPHTQPPEAAGPTSRTVAFRYRAQVADVPADARAAYLWLPCPPTTEDQRIEGMRVDTSLPHEIVTEPKHGNRAVRVALRHLLRQLNLTTVVCEDVVAVTVTNEPGYPDFVRVYPVADLPRVALEAGARLVIVNAEDTPYDRVAKAVVREQIGDVLPKIVALV